MELRRTFSQQGVRFHPRNWRWYRGEVRRLQSQGALRNRRLSGEGHDSQGDCRTRRLAEPTYLEAMARWAKVLGLPAGTVRVKGGTGACQGERRRAWHDPNLISTKSQPLTWGYWMCVHEEPAWAAE